MTDASSPWYMYDFYSLNAIKIQFPNNMHQIIIQKSIENSHEMKISIILSQIQSLQTLHLQAKGLFLGSKFEGIFFPFCR